MIVEASEEMERAAVENLDFFRRIIDWIDDLGEAVIRNILSRLPAKPFASAACVSRSWNTICNSILSFPKLSSAVSFNPSLEKALNEVVEKVLMEPIRPHFVLASIGPCFILQAALRRIEGIFGSKIPIIINVAEGVIGRDVRTDKFVEVQWALSAAKKKYSWPTDTQPTATCGMILTVGFLPGLKVHLVPLFQSEGPQSLFVDKFVMDIREVASAVSHSSSPAGIMLFADRKTNILPVLQKTEYAFPKDTFIVGDGGSELIFRISETTTVPPDSTFAAVALLFTRDINKPLGIGEIQFHVMLSTGVTAVGPVYKILSVEDHGTSTCFTATRDTIPEPFEGEAILHDILDELLPKGKTKRVQHLNFVTIASLLIHLTRIPVTVKFIAHLVNQRVAHELIALELLTLLLENPTDDSIEVVMGFVTECGCFLHEIKDETETNLIDLFEELFT
ncbi:PREDICTED: F-box/LRR-repeat protein At5g63520-like [Erythranthe guttata]|uniref:F-box/LRR-repeat protein At5g63520-like n=1 Tax=Erythranthe guttata TaxID=4155 RepID=UPI00064DF377|nr:PREDICTED: F-box/LRR-repeat protein At5g63520-like [Erythranthe guttata]|eukprot:XP_012847913.1 PREDICTED: F-box/LRR-repeat protein At5g63520-like [Erythranthe guttata]